MNVRVNERMDWDECLSLTKEICKRLKVACMSAGYNSVAKFSEAFQIPKTTDFQQEHGVTLLHIDLLCYWAVAKSKK